MCPICAGRYGDNVRCHGATREQVLTARREAAAERGSVPPVTERER